MITLKEAIDIAAKTHGQRFEEFDTWFEYEKAFVFFNTTIEAVGGIYAPFMVRKDTGKIDNGFPQAMMNDELGNELASGSIGQAVD